MWTHLGTVLVLLTLTISIYGICNSTTGCFPEPFNVLKAVSSSVSTSSVCGLNSTSLVQYQSLNDSDKTVYTCQPDTVQPSNMVDNKTGSSEIPTFWQSELMADRSGVLVKPQFVIFNFSDEFIFHTINIEFLAPHTQTVNTSTDARPAAFTFQKISSTSTWVNLEHLARNCSRSFPGVPLLNPATPSTDVTQLHCVEYVSQSNTNNNQVEYSPWKRSELQNHSFTANVTVSDYFTTSALRLLILEPASTSPLKSYVAISNVVIEVQCQCHGHASNCSGQNNATCDCQHNTTGQHCESCLSLFNARRWMPGTSTDAGLCLECNCNSSGTVGNKTSGLSCDANTGQCPCATTGIVGRTCDRCSPVSKNNYEHIDLIYLGTYPDCQLCGECFDSWAWKVEEIAQAMSGMNKTIFEAWRVYDYESAEVVRSKLDTLEQKINSTTKSLEDLGYVTGELRRLQQQFSQLAVQEENVTAEVDRLTQTQQLLSAQLDALSVQSGQDNNTTDASLPELQIQLSNMSTLANNIMRQGNESWNKIQSLVFVVAAPQEREANLKTQVARIMETAGLANQTLQLLSALHELTLHPGMLENNRTLVSLRVKVENTSETLKSTESDLMEIQNNTRQSGEFLASATGEASISRSSLLDTVITLQAYVTNASRVQRQADKLYLDASNFRNVSKTAEGVLVNSTLGLHAQIAQLGQAQTDLDEAKSLSSTISAVEAPSLAAMLNLVAQINLSPVSSEEVAYFKLDSQKMKFLANQMTAKVQKALSTSKELSEIVDQMEADISLSRNLRNQSELVKASSDSFNSSIHTVIEQVQKHTEAVRTNVSQNVGSAGEIQANITTATACLVQQQLSVNNAVAASAQIKEEADKAVSGQLQLLQLMLDINSVNLTSLLHSITSTSQAGSEIRNYVGDLEQVKALSRIEDLLQELQAQNQQVKDLDENVSQLTSQLDGLILLLQESDGGSSCNTG